MRGKRLFLCCLRDNRGATAVEYGLILSLIFLAMAGALSGVAGETLRMWTHVESESAKAHNKTD
ncbi:Flp family type IVb pilin [Novosphingobium sp. M1R2S20]|uniref:Flp family type IVb pilin n=1 Tax=Novosphingobium rhizovicinum TaxID=3228928 RepID=A0ABV3R7E7_9SPHN